MVTIERFAQLRAAMETATSRDEVLRREGLTTKAWLAAQRRWLGAISADVRDGRRDLADRYLRAYLAANAPDVTAASSEPAADEQPAPPPAVQRAWSPPASAPVAPPPVPVATPPTPPAVVIQHKPPAPRATAAMPAMPDVHTTLPFADGDARPSSVADEVAGEAADLVGETGFVDALKIDDEPLPFPKAVASGKPPGSVNETSFVDAASLDLAEPLPFQRHEAQRPAPAAEAVAAEGAHLVGGTAFVPALNEDEAPDARSEAQPAPAELSLEQVVALFVDVADDASSREATMQRYGLSDSADLDRLRAQWNERRRQSADIRASWQSAHATYTAWKKQRG